MAQLLVKTIADFVTTLVTKVDIGATTGTLTSGLDGDGIQLPTGTYGFTIDRNNSKKEYFTATLTGTALTNVKTVTRGTGVGTAGFARSHRKGAEIIISDHVAIKRMMNVLDATTGFDSATHLKYDAAPAGLTGNELVTVDYVGSVIVNGAIDASTTAKGIVEEATQAEVDAGTAAGGTAARLFQNPSTIRAKNYNDYIADSGSTDAYAISPTVPITAYAAGQIFTFKANTLNTGAATLAVSGLAAKTIKKKYNQDLATGDILANQIVIVVYDGTNFQLASVSSLSTPIPTVQAFTATGANTYTAPANLVYAIVEVQGGGAGGVTIGPASTAGGGGGGGGGYSRRILTAAQIGASQTATVGAGGAAATNGGNSSFGALAIGNGGSTGSGTSGGAGGTATTGDLNIPGGDGGNGFSGSTPMFGGMGGGSFMGSGGGSSIMTASTNSAMNGGAGSKYGGGGGGGAAITGNTGTGGAGKDGIIIVTEFY